MDEIIKIITGFLVMSVFFFLPIPIGTFLIVFCMRVIFRLIKKNSLQAPFLIRSDWAVVFLIIGALLLIKKRSLVYFVHSDLKVALFCLPFWGLCTVLPGAQTKSMLNLIEPMILGGIWGGFLFVRLILVLCRISKYKMISCCGNVLVFILCILFAYFFPSLPE